MNRMRPTPPAKPGVGWAALAFFASSLAGAEPIDLKGAVTRALESEAEYRSVRAELEAVREEKARARAGLLPTLSASGTHTDNDAERTFADGSSDDPNYTSFQYSLTLKQPILRRDNWVKYRQAGTRIASAEQQADTERIKLVLDVSEQYLDCLYADAVVRFAQAEVTALEGLLTAVTRGFAAGTSTRTDILDAEARLDAARVRLIEASQLTDSARRALESSTGRPVSAIHPIVQERLVLQDPQLRIRDWRDAALRDNPEVRAAQFNVDLARQEVQLQQAGHYPSLDLVVQQQHSESDSISTLDVESRITLWGVQFNVPLYSGGLVNASTRQAGSRLARAQAELDAKREEVSLRTARAVEALLADSQRVQALSRAEASSVAALIGTEKGLQAGTRSFVDVLNARQQLFEVQQSRARANADFILALLNLKAAAGLADDSAIDEANAFLAPEASVVFPALAE